MATLRVTSDLSDLVRRTAHHCGLTVSDIMCRTVRYAERRPALYADVTLHGNGESVTNLAEFIRWAGDIPDSVSPARLRSVLRMRCAEALAKPGAVRFQTDKTEGIDYTVSREA